MAFIRKRPTRNGVAYDIVEKIGGKQIRKKTPARSLTEAREYLKVYEFERSSCKPISLLIKEVTFKHLAEEYLQYSVNRKMQSSYSKDYSIIKQFITSFGSLRLNQLTQLYIESLQDKWKHGGKSNKTINNRSILLGTMLRFALDRNYLMAIPKIKKLKVDKRRPQFFTDADIQLILTSAEPLLRDYVIFMLNTGLRLGELKRLTWEDVDIQNHLIRVEVSKSHRFRTIPINDVLNTLLIRKNSERKAKTVYVFEYAEGKPLSDYYHRFKKLLNSLGIEGHVHKLRHTFASNLVRNAVPIYEVQNLLGHASGQTTQIYAHIRMDNLQKAVNSLNGCTTGAQKEKQLTFLAS